MRLDLNKTSRRTFNSGCAAWLLLSRGSLLAGQTTATLYGSSRPNVAALDHDRILAAADKFLTVVPAPLTHFPAAASPGTPRDFYSEADADEGKPPAFTVHREALLNVSRQVAALAAAYQLTHEDRYAEHATKHLRAWFLDPATSMTPSLLYGQMPAAVGKTERRSTSSGLLDAVFLAEIAQAVAPLSQSKAAADELTGIKAWFASYLQWLTESRLAGLARDQKDRHASSWLLQATTIARLTSNDSVLTDLRHRFKTVTLRAQIVADGTFPHELQTAFPYRYSLFNLDMLTASCELLSSRFENLWEIELQDGPGMRSVMARHYPFILNRRSWPYRADLTHFDDLPVRNPALIFAARAYTRPEYAELWKTLNPDPTIPEIARCFPISQPLLWVNRLRT